MPDEEKSKRPTFDSLKPQWQKFLRKYLQHYNATKAYKQAGYSENGAGESAYQLLKKPQIKEAQRELEEEDMRKWDAEGPRRLMQEYLAIAYVDPKDFYDDEGNIKPVRQMSKAARSALAELVTETSQFGDDESKVKVAVTRLKRYDKLKAMEAIAKRVSLWPEEVEGDKDINLHVVFEEEPVANEE